MKQNLKVILAVVIIPLGDSEFKNFFIISGLETSLNDFIVYFRNYTYIMILRGLIAAAIVHCIVGPPVDKKGPGKKSFEMFLVLLI